VGRRLSKWIKILIFRVLKPEFAAGGGPEISAQKRQKKFSRRTHLTANQAAQALQKWSFVQSATAW
jgi:hypothetical protein